jgi:hypothetical protein
MHIPPLLSHNMLRYYDMFDDVLASKNSPTKFTLALEEKKQQLIEQMLSAIVNHLSDTATKQEEWRSAVGAPYRLIPGQERKGYGTPT